MSRNKVLQVLMDDRKVGTLAEAGNRLVGFEYDAGWLADGFSVSPFSLPLQKGVFFPEDFHSFEGLFGVFADSLPDGWGRLLVDRLILKNGLNPAALTSLDRLAIVGNSGMGALRYIPEYNLQNEGNTDLSLDDLARECALMFDSETSDNLDELFRLGGSSGGARPKIFYTIDGEDWIVKFPSSLDRKNIGKEEYDYSVCAKKCGVEMAETRLLDSKTCSGYFATKRFDRSRDQRIHMVSVSALLETSHRIPNLDYEILLQLAMQLTHDYQEVEKMFTLMCFNVFAHNRDDHSKNFSFVYDVSGRWKLSPAYDLTYSNSIGGEHATTINGNGKNPGEKDILALAQKMKLDMQWAQSVMTEVQETVRSELEPYLRG